MSITIAVIPAAGLGSRFLPATKGIPKELLPLIDKPVIQYVIEEAVASNIDHVVIITSPGKSSLEKYFQPDHDLELLLQKKGSFETLEKIKEVSSLVDISYVQQDKPLGLGHAVLLAKNLIGKQPFAVMLPDDIIQSEEPTLGDLIKLYGMYDSSIIGVEKIPLEKTVMYGVISPKPITKSIYKILELVEKPPSNKAPSDLGIVGRYVLPSEIFDILQKTAPGSGGEIQLTDAIKTLLYTRDIYAYQFPGRRHDTGTPLGLLQASISIAIEHEYFGEHIINTLKKLI